MAKWLLAVFAEPGSKVTEEEFNKWYDEEHIPVRLKTKGFASAARFKSVDSVTPKASYAAVYELDDGDVLTSPETREIVENASDNEKDIISRMESLQWRLYKPIIDSAFDLPELPKPTSLDFSQFFTFTTVNVQPEHDKDFNEWFHEDHIPMFAKVPGWVRTRRYTLAAHGDLAGSLGQPLHYLSAHDTSDPGTYDTPEFKAMPESPGMKKITPWLTGFEERKFGLYKNFGKGTA